MKKNTKILPLYHAFDELEACKGLFERKKNPFVNNKFASYINFCIYNNSCIEVLKAVSKYLLFGDIYKNEEDKQKYQNPLMVRKLLWKWIVVNIYLVMNPTDLMFMNATLNEFKTGIDVYDLINLELDDDSLYAHLLNDSKFTDNKIKEYLSGKYTKYARCIESLVKLNYSFFNFDPRLEYYTEGRHNSKLDLVVCDVMLDSSFFKFNYELIDEEEFIQNIDDDYMTDTDIRCASTFIGLLTHKIIYDGKVTRFIELNRNKLNIYTLNKGFNVSNVIKFVEGDSTNDTREIHYKDIVPFRIKYNNEIYIVDKKGINRIRTSEN